MKTLARQGFQSSFVSSPFRIAILQQMSAELPELRPPVIQTETRQSIDEYRSFRHVVRNVYTFDLQPDRVVALTAKLIATFAAFKSDIEAFCDFLASVSADL